MCLFAISSELKAMLTNLQQYFPLLSDYDNAKAALIRLQVTYQLPIDSLAKGEILGYTTMPLSLETVVEIGKHALLSGDAVSAINWLTYALSIIDTSRESPVIPRQELLVELGRSYALVCMYWFVCRGWCV